MGPPVALPGREIQCTEVDLFERCLALNHARAALVDPGNFPCRHCSHFRDHVQYPFSLHHDCGGLLQFRVVRARVRLEEERDLLAFHMSAGSLLLSQEYADKLKVSGEAR